MEFKKWCLFVALFVLLILGYFFDFLMLWYNSFLKTGGRPRCKDCGHIEHITINVLLFSKSLKLPHIPVKGVQVERTYFRDGSTSKQLNNRSRFLLHWVQRPFDVVIFSVHDMPGGNTLHNVSSFRAKHQRWAYQSHESPYNTLNIVHGQYDGIFNMTITTRTDSHIFAPYGYHRKKKRTDPWRYRHPGLNIFKRNPMTDYETRLQQEDMVLSDNLSYREKDLGVAWVVSHCDTYRDDYVTELLNYLRVDVYGKCGVKFRQTRICRRDTLSCELRLRRYRFVLAFENSLCRDYITEKYWSALFRGNLPIVMGGASYGERTAVPGSFINARNFQSAKALAAYVNFVMSSEAEYDKYFEWRQSWQIDVRSNDYKRMDRVLADVRDYVLRVPHPHHQNVNISQFFDAKQNCENTEES